MCMEKRLVRGVESGTSSGWTFLILAAFLDFGLLSRRVNA